MRGPLIVILMIIFFLFVPNALANLEIGMVPDTISLQEKLGGRLDGTPWSSEELKGTKVSVIFYADPDEKDLNNEASEALQKEAFSREKFQSYAVINMGATWLPKFIISGILKSKQKKYPDTIYVKDYKKVLAKLQKNGIINESGQLLKAVKLSDITEAI